MACALAVVVFCSCRVPCVILYGPRLRLQYRCLQVLGSRRPGVTPPCAETCGINVTLAVADVGNIVHITAATDSAPDSHNYEVVVRDTNCDNVTFFITWYGNITLHVGSSWHTTAETISECPITVMPCPCHS